MTEYPKLYFPAGHELDLKPAELEAIPRLLGAAALAATASRQSGFAVPAAVMNEAGEIASGGNREYGLAGAYVHGEEAALSALLSKYPETPLLGLGFYAEGATPEHLFPCPCGNCRDVLREEAPGDLLLACGNETLAVVTRLDMYLSSVQESVGVQLLEEDAMLAHCFHGAYRALKRGSSMYLPHRLQNKSYGVALLDTSGSIFSGSLDINIGYDTTSPGVAAVQSFRNRPEGSELPIEQLQAIMIVGPAAAEKIQPLYRDRAALSELCEILQSERSDKRPLPVYLAHADTAGRPVTLHKTDTSEWLPFPYTNESLASQVRSSQKLQALSIFG